MGNPFCHIELSTEDVDKAKRFYGSLFDWKLTAAPGMPYTLIDIGKVKGRGVGGGMQGLQMPGQPTAWLSYVEVPDVAKTLAKAAKGGAKVVLPRMEIPGGMGAVGVFIDPQGAALGLWEPPPPKKAGKKGDAKKAEAKKAEAKKAETKKAETKKADKAEKADGKKAAKKADSKKAAPKKK